MKLKVNQCKLRKTDLRKNKKHFQIIKATSVMTNLKYKCFNARLGRFSKAISKNFGYWGFMSQNFAK